MKNIKCRNCFFYRNEWCEKIVDSPDPEEARDCNYFREMTNADRIRAMSDMEIAEASSFRFCPSEMIDKSCVFRNCKECWIEWLQQPAGEEDKHESN